MSDDEKQMSRLCMGLIIFGMILMMVAYVAVITWSTHIQRMFV